MQTLDQNLVFFDELHVCNNNDVISDVNRQLEIKVKLN